MVHRAAALASPGSSWRVLRSVVSAVSEHQLQAGQSVKHVNMQSEAAEHVPEAYRSIRRSRDVRNTCMHLIQYVCPPVSETTCLSQTLLGVNIWCKL